MIWRIALKNLLRNRRRSLITIFSIGVGGLAILLFGGFVSSVFYGVQTTMIQDQGHIQIFKQDYQRFGAADPDRYVIDDYHAVIDAIRSDEKLNQAIAVITPQIRFFGIAGVEATDFSKTFIGRAVIPEQADLMRHWDGWKIGAYMPATNLAGQENDKAIIGVGMAGLLGLCKPLSISDCEDPPLPEKLLMNETQDFSSLIDHPETLSVNAVEASLLQLNLLAATSLGTPNIMSVWVKGVQIQPHRSVDDSFIMVHFDLARQLLYGNDPKATMVLVQLKDSSQVGRIKELIQQRLDDSGLKMEVFRFNEIDPSFDRIIAMFSFIFGVVSLFLGVIIAFTIANTVNLTIMERVREIGTIRAIGFRRSFIIRMFVAESTLLGLFGVVLTMILTLCLTVLINAAHIQWTPPSNASPITLKIMVFENPVLLVGVSVFLLFITVLATLWPTYKASRMQIVSALHHV